MVTRFKSIFAFAFNFCLAFAGLSLAACDAEERIAVEPLRVTSVVVSPQAVGMEPGDTFTASATLVDQHGYAFGERVPGWMSSKHSVASVTASGKITAVDTGRAMIIASSEGVADTSIVSVARPLVIVEPVIFFVHPVSITLSVGESVHMHVGGAPADFPATWQFGTEGIVAIDSRGVMTGLKSGSTTARAVAASGKSSQASVTVR